MTWPIHEKITRLLKERRQKKKDLAAHLGIAPQTMTDICKGRSAVTLSHLKGLVTFFGLRADWWLDEDREEPSPFDRTGEIGDEDLRRLEQLGLGDAKALERTLHKVRAFLGRHRGQWEEENGSFTPEEARILEIGEIKPLIPRPEPLPGTPLRHGSVQ
ncbi:MAG: XRE family transcriptional regulator [Planctomycetota bacterium]